MGNFGNFSKGDKKKKKKGSDKAQNPGSLSNKPVFVMPKMVEKKRKGE